MGVIGGLKPCPFCGSTALYEGIYDMDGFDTPMVFCDWCKAMFTVEGSEDWIGDGSNDGMDKLRAAWNMRAETGKIENLCKLVIQLWSFLSVKGYGDEASEMLCDGADEIFDPKDIDRRIKELRRELGIGAEQ